MGWCAGRYRRVAEEQQAQNRVGPEQVYEGATQTPARQGEHSKPSHYQEDGVRKGQAPTLRGLEGGTDRDREREKESKGGRLDQ